MVSTVWCFFVRGAPCVVTLRWLHKALAKPKARPASRGHFLPNSSMASHDRVPRLMLCLCQARDDQSLLLPVVVSHWVRPGGADSAKAPCDVPHSRLRTCSISIERDFSCESPGRTSHEAQSVLMAHTLWHRERKLSFLDPLIPCLDGRKART